MPLSQIARFGPIGSVVASRPREGMEPAAGLLNFLLQWKTSLHAFRSLGKMFGRGRHGQDPLDELEAPMWWFLAGQVISLAVLGYLAKRTFDMPYWVALLALVLSFFLALVACRVTGETDTTPLTAVGQLTQMTVGSLHPGSATTTLMSANIVSSAAISSADLLTDLKSGYLLGANPRKQFLAQFAGIFVGTLASFLPLRLLVACWQATVAKFGPSVAMSNGPEVLRSVSGNVATPPGEERSIDIWASWLAIRGPSASILGRVRWTGPRLGRLMVQSVGWNP